MFIICKSCGKTNQAANSSCSACGMSLHDEELADTPPPEETHATPRTPVPPATTRMESVSTDASNRLTQDATIQSPEPSETVRVKTTYYASRIARDAPLAVAFSFPRVLIAGFPSFFCIEVKNLSGGPLDLVEVLVESRGLASPVMERTPLEAEKSARLQPHLEPVRHGNFVLQCTVKVTIAGQIKGFIGTHVLCVNPPPKDVNQLIDPRLIQTNHTLTDSAGAQEPELVSLHAIPGGSALRTLDDLLKFKLPNQWVPLSLSYDYQVSLSAVEHTTIFQARHVIIYQLFLNWVQPGTLLKLTPVEPAKESKEPVSPAVNALHLVARPVFKIGRSRDPAHAADLITWCLPRNRANDEKTRHLGRIHVTAERQGAQLMLRDNHSVGGTTFDGVPVPSTGGEPLNRRAVLVLGGEYPMDVQPMPTAYPQGPEIKNIALWKGPETPMPECHGAVRFSPINSELAHHDAVWLLTDATFGTSRSNAVVFNLPGLAEIQGRFHHFRGCFWVENRIPNQGVFLNQRPLGGNEIAPLMSGLILQLGQVSFQVEVQP